VFTPATQEEIEQFSKLMGQFLRVKEWQGKLLVTSADTSPFLD
jgi:hypothetical protein